MKISIITTCKSRLHHLIKVIDSWVNFKPHEIIVVDVNSPDGLAYWLKENVSEVKIQGLDRNNFNLSEARNCGAKAASGDYLFFVDSDILLADGLHEWFDSHMLINHHAVRIRENAYDGIHEQGTVLVSKENYIRVGGFDEVFSGYGGEDHDFYEKLSRAGSKKIEFPKLFISSLDHNDEERTLHYAIKDKNVQSIINRVYRSIKESLLSRDPGRIELPLETRKKLWADINIILGNNFQEMNGKRLNFKTILKKWLPPPYYMEEKFSISLEIKVREPSDIHQ